MVDNWAENMEGIHENIQFLLHLKSCQKSHFSPELEFWLTCSDKDNKFFLVFQITQKFLSSCPLLSGLLHFNNIIKWKNRASDTENSKLDKLGCA